MSREFFLLFLIVSHLKVAHPLEEQNALIDSCAKFNWNEEFFPKGEQTRWNDTVKADILRCFLTNYSKVSEIRGGCNVSIVNVTFPLFSNSSNVTPLERRFCPVLVIKAESFTTGRQIFHAFAQIWKLLVLCILAAMLSGIVIWFLDHRANSGHFPNSFRRGVTDGWWWAVVTMTTVGYGDKAPRSSLARVYASLWMIIGMLLMSTITAQISSSITADELRPLNDMFGDKVGVPLGSKKFLEKDNRGTSVVKEYRTERKLLNGLMDGSVNKIWLFSCGTEEVQKHHSRLTIVGESEEYLKVMVGFSVEEGYEDFERCLQSTERHDALGCEDFCEFDESCFEMYSHGKNRHNMKQGSSEGRVEPFHFILLAFAGILVILLLIGSLWNACMKKTPTTDDVDIEKGVSDTELRASISSKVHTKELSTPSVNFETAE